MSHFVIESALSNIYACPAQNIPTKECVTLQGKRVMPQKTALIQHQNSKTKGFAVELQLAGSLKRLWLPIEN